MTTQLDKKQVKNTQLENAELVHGKICCIIMMGNDVWKHQRDYEALEKLLVRWNDSLQDNELDNQFKKELKPYLIKTPDDFEDDWNLMNSLRIISHNYMNNFGDYPSDECEMPDMKIIKKIRELTNS